MKSLKNEKGQALVEFTIILPILLILVMGILEFGIMLNSYLSIENAAREGARAGTMGTSDVNIKNTIIKTSPSLDPKNLAVTITPTDLTRKSGDTLTVHITYSHKLITPIISNLLHNVVSLNYETSMRVE